MFVHHRDDPLLEFLPSGHTVTCHQLHSAAFVFEARLIPAQIFDEETAAKDKENLHYNAADTLDAAAAAAGFAASLSTPASGAGAGRRRRSSSSSSSSSSSRVGGGGDGRIDKQRQEQPDDAQQQHQQPEAAKLQHTQVVTASALGSENFSTIVRWCSLYLWRDMMRCLVS